MKMFKNLAVYLAALALCGAVTVRSVEPGKIAQTAKVRSVKGAVTYTLNGVTKPLKANAELPAGAVITTGPDSEVYMNVNGLSSAVRVEASTTLTIPEMDKIGAAREADTETQLDLKVGSILGQVKKVQANSSYEIKTPHGVAGIRGTDFSIKVNSLPNGGFAVSFTCIQGTVVVSGLDAQGNVVTETLGKGQSCSFTPTSTSGVTQTLATVLAALANDITTLGNTITANGGSIGPVTGGGGGGGGGNGGGNGGGGGGNGGGGAGSGSGGGAGGAGGGGAGGGGGGGGGESGGGPNPTNPFSGNGGGPPGGGTSSGVK